MKRKQKNKNRRGFPARFLSFKIKLNGNEIEVYCPKQKEYILEKCSRKI